jgi:hypothetical protein
MAFLLALGAVWTAITMSLISVGTYRAAAICRYYMALAGITFLYISAASGFAAIGRHLANHGFA